MGILNLTPDSFSDGGRYPTVDDAVQAGVGLVEAGAEVLDLGGESTRPGYEPVDPEEQCRRVLPTLERLRERVDVPISIDTTRRLVAERALDLGADWINDTSAFGEDPELADLCAERRSVVVLMLRTSPPRNDGDSPSGRAFVRALANRLREKIEEARARGIDPTQIVVDPGIGFGLAPGDNVDVHAFVEELTALDAPLLIGASRKRFLGHLTGRATADRIHATAASTAVLCLAGVDYLRVHDTAAMRDVVAVCQAVRERLHDERGTDRGAR